MTGAIFSISPVTYRTTRAVLATKPNIILTGGKWYCIKYDTFAGIGVDPVDAYTDWLTCNADSRLVYGDRGRLNWFCRLFKFIGQTESRGP